MNIYNRAAKYVNIMLLAELTMLILVVIVINYLLRSMNIDLSTILLYAIEIIGNLVYVFALARLHKLLGKDFKKAILCIIIVTMFSVAALLFEQLLENEVLYLITIAIVAVGRMLCYYFLLSSFQEICADMNNVYLARQFQMCRTAYMIGVILNAATGSDMLSEFIGYAFNLVYQIVSIYVLLMYNRLRKALSEYKEPEQDEI